MEDVDFRGNNQSQNRNNDGNLENAPQQEMSFDQSYSIEKQKDQEPPSFDFAMEDENGRVTEEKRALPRMPAVVARKLLAQIDPRDLPAPGTELKLGPCESTGQGSYAALAYGQTQKRYRKNNITQGPDGFLRRQVAKLRSSSRPRDIGDHCKFAMMELAKRLPAEQRPELCTRFDAFLAEIEEAIRAQSEPIPIDQLLTMQLQQQQDLASAEEHQAPGGGGNAV